MTFIRKWAKKWASRTQSDYRETFSDFMQEALFAEWRGKDPIDAVRQAWKYLEFGKTEHRKSKHDKPILVEPREYEHITKSIEGEIVNRDLIRKIWQRVGAKARAAMRANYIGAPYVWRPEVKAELFKAAMEFERKC
jgi:hypothetical protein